MRCTLRWAIPKSKGLIFSPSEHLLRVCVKVEESYSQKKCASTPANMVTTKIINRTTKPLKLKVGNNRAFRDITTIQKDGGVHEVSVDPNATYQEYCIAVVDAVAGKQFVVNSDECVDNKSITIVEADSKFDVVKEPRQSQAWKQRPLL